MIGRSAALMAVGVGAFALGPVEIAVILSSNDVNPAA